MSLEENQKKYGWIKVASFTKINKIMVVAE